MGSPLLDETLEAVAAANEYVRAKEERALAAGRSVYFMDEGRFYKRNRESVFEIIQGFDGRWVRTHELGRRLDERKPELDRALAR
jgi:hypothetical protein